MAVPDSEATMLGGLTRSGVDFEDLADLRAQSGGIED